MNLREYGKHKRELPGVHIECKRMEKLNIYDAISQAKRDKHFEELAAVFHRKNNTL